MTKAVVDAGARGTSTPKRKVPENVTARVGSWHLRRIVWPHFRLDTVDDGTASKFLELLTMKAQHRLCRSVSTDTMPLCVCLSRLGIWSHRKLFLAHGYFSLEWLIRM
jgi:hypothetical protein